MNKEILYIGSLRGNKPTTCGQTIKTQLIKKVLEQEGFKLRVVDLSYFKNNPFKQLISIKKGVRECDVVFAIPGPRAAHIVLPFLYRCNKKINKKIIYCSIGAGYVSEFITNRYPNFYKDFIEGIEIPKPKRRDTDILKSFAYNLFETRLLCDIHKRFYGLTNCHILENFRCFDESIIEDTRVWKNNSLLRIIYCSRITKEKGIFDLLKTIVEFNKNNLSKICLDIFGKLNDLSESEKNLFYSYCDGKFINYKGFLDNSLVIETMSNYHLFCLPTRFLGEGTPGAIAESLIAGTPVLSSDFFQAKYIIKDGFNGLLFHMADTNSLYEKFTDLFSNGELLFKLHQGAKESRKRFIYSYQRELFLKYIID